LAKKASKRLTAGGLFMPRKPKSKKLLVLFSGYIRLYGSPIVGMVHGGYEKQELRMSGNNLKFSRIDFIKARRYVSYTLCE
jgi:hypothetical protein